MRVFTVSQIASYLRERLEADVALADLWISGEVADLSRPRSGHSYFTLKDQAAQLPAVFFLPRTQRQMTMLEHLRRGAQVVVHGRLTFYEVRGQVQVVVDFVQPEGVGLARAQFERLRQQLEEEGLFDIARKRRLPPFPRSIGVATSASGAVFHDICNILGRRWPLAEVVLAPTPVQGPEAAPGLVAAVEALNRRPGIEVIVVARGGGSDEDLSAFNDERVARAVFASAAPVVSAVGHETDTTICDFVADVRAPTPSAAAEIVAPDRVQVARHVDALLGRGLGSLRNVAARDRRGVESALARCERMLPDVGRLRQRAGEWDRRAAAGVLAAAASRRERLNGVGRQLMALDPKATLRRGYAVVHKGGRVVSSVSQVETGDALVVRVADGGFPARVDTPPRRRRRPAAPPVERDGERPGGRGVQPALFF